MCYTVLIPSVLFYTGIWERLCFISSFSVKRILALYALGTKAAGYQSSSASEQRVIEDRLGLPAPDAKLLRRIYTLIISIIDI